MHVPSDHKLQSEQDTIRPHKAGSTHTCEDRDMGRTVGFVLGGGGVLGAVEVGMVHALYDAGIRPDLVVGTSIGALNGVVLAAVPMEEAPARLTELWSSPAARSVFRASVAR